MFLLYLDDSGSPRNPSETHFVLGGVCLPESRLYHLNKHLDALAETIDADNPSSVEFHASEIFSRRSAHWKDFSWEQSVSTIKSVLGVLKRNRKAVLFASAVHKASFPHENPVKVAFEDLCSRFEMFIARSYNNTKKSQQGLIIIDKSVYENELQDLARDFKTSGTRWRVTSNISEVPLFVDSKASRIVQLADHVAYAVYRRYTHDDLNYFNEIQGLFDSEDGKMHGLSHKQRAIPDCTCPNCLNRQHE